MSTSPYFKQIEQKILVLLADKKFNEADAMCTQFLEKYPDEKIFAKLRQKIEEAVDEENKKVISEKLSVIQKLISEEKYADVLIKLKRVLQLSPSDKRLNDLYAEMQIRYHEQIQRQQAGFLTQERAELEDLLDKNPDALLAKIYNLEESNLRNPAALKLAQEFRSKLVHKKIAEKQDLIYSTKYADIRNFLFNLRKIDVSNAEIEEVDKQVKKRAFKHQIEQIQDFIYRGKVYMENLLKLKKYEPALRLGEELIEIDQDNIEIEKLLKKAQRKYYKQTREKTIADIAKDSAELKNEYKKDKTKFIRI